MQKDIIVQNEEYNDINPVLFGYEKCKKSHRFGPAVRSYWLIHFVESGHGTFEINGKIHKLSSGEMFVIPPGEITTYKADDINPWQYTWIGFTACDKFTSVLTPVIKNPNASYIFNSMKKSEKMFNNVSAFLTARLWDLYVLLAENQEQSPDCIEMALSCIHSEYSRRLSVGELAKRLNVDRSYFSTLFKKRVGVPPEKYLLNLRMKTAASLLAEHGKSVAVAGNSVGYTNLYNFSKMFKKYFGVSPSEYANQTAPR